MNMKEKQQVDIAATPSSSGPAIVVVDAVVWRAPFGRIVWHLVTNSKTMTDWVLASEMDTISLTSISN